MPGNFGEFLWNRGEIDAMIKTIPPRRPCDCENIADFQRYYRYSSVGWQLLPTGPAAVTVHTTDRENVFLVNDVGVVIAIPWARAQEELSFGAPDLGMVNG